METLQHQGLYCNSLTRYSRILSREVFVGSIPLGGNNPIRVQSMTTTDTMNTMATVEQSIRMIEAGCEYVRITAPSINEARNLEVIKKELRARGYQTPLIADIHFTPNAAEVAARIVEKVRINPGNFADRKKFDFIEYTDDTYEAELLRIRERFLPLVKICKEYGTAMRIGTNHGSLSDRILSRYGDTPQGMVESALEFLRICEGENYHNIVLSMKSSNAQVMVQAYRLLVSRMAELNMNYPLHLGVTEAGEGEDGRIKSATGIGTLLEDGIGDTIRVSLTEDPEFEIPVALNLVKRYANRSSHAAIKELGTAIKMPYNPFEYKRRVSATVQQTGGANVPRVIADYSTYEKITAASLYPVGYNYSVATDKWNLSDQACDYIYAGTNAIDFALPGTLGVILNYATWKNSENTERRFPLFSAAEFIAAETKSPELNFILVGETDIFSPSTIAGWKKDSTVVLIMETNNAHAMAALRRMMIELMNAGCNAPVIFKRNYQGITEEQLQLQASTDLGALLLDGFGDGVFLTTNGIASPKNINALAFGINSAGFDTLRSLSSRRKCAR